MLQVDLLGYMSNFVVLQRATLLIRDAQPFTNSSRFLDGQLTYDRIATLLVIYLDIADVSNSAIPRIVSVSSKSKK